MTTLRRRPGDRASANAGEPVYRLDTMTQDDVPDVSRVERRCFANPWPASAYRRELQNPAQNYYVVLRAIRASSPAESGPDNRPSGATAAESEESPPRPSLGARYCPLDAVDSRTATGESRPPSSASRGCGWPLTRHT